MPQKWLIAASHPLESIFKVSAYHLATGLARRSENEIFYLCAPISPFHRARRDATTDLATRESLWRNGPRLHRERLREYCPKTLLPYLNRPFFRSKWVVWQSLRWTRPSLMSVLRKANFVEPDVLMVINLQYAGLLDMVRPRLRIYRNIDELSGMSHVPPSMLEIEREIAPRVDAVITVSVVQEEKMWSYDARRVYRLPHGVDWELYRGPLPPLPGDFQRIPAPRVIFVGALAQWVDHELVGNVARILPRVSFVFIGPADPPFPGCLTAPNMHYLGPRPYEAVPAYLRHSQAAMIPFGKSAIVESAHPLKLLIYLAAGLPTVCSPWKELQAMGLPVRIGGNARDFARQIDRVVSGEIDREALAESVQEYDWSNIIDRLEAIVAEVRKETAPHGTDFGDDLLDYSERHDA